MQGQSEAEKMVKKGFAHNIIALGMILLALIVISYIGFFHIRGPMQIEGSRSLTLHQKYYTMDNALSLSKLYLATGLRFSVYQVMYDNGYRGGLSEVPEENLEGKVLWYDNQDIYPDEQSLLDNLKAPALEGLGRYLESDYVFLDDYSVKLPQYSKLEIEKTHEGRILANATADKNLWIKRIMQNLDKIELEKSASLEEDFGSAYLALYQEALERLDEVKARFGEIKELLDSVKKGSLTREQEGSRPQITEEEVFLKTLEDAGIAGAVSRGDGETKLSDRFETILNKLKDQPGGIVVQFKKKSSFVVAEFQESDCKLLEDTSRTGDGKTYYTVTKECTFKYAYEFTINVSVTDNSGKRYPVFNTKKDEIAQEPLAFAFTAREKS